MTTTVSLTIERIKVKVARPKPERDKRPRKGSMVAVAYKGFVAPGRVIEIRKDGSALVEATSGYETGRRYDCSPRSWHPNPAQLYQWGREDKQPTHATPVAGDPAIPTAQPTAEPIHTSPSDHVSEAGNMIDPASMGPDAATSDPRQEDSR